MLVEDRVSAPQTVQLDDCRGTLIWRNLVFTVWRPAPMRIESLREFARQTVARGEALAPRKLTLVAMLGSAPLPASALMPVMADNAQRIAPYVRAQVSIFRATGVKAAAMQSLLTSLMVASQGSVDEESFETDSEAIPWTFEHARRDDPTLELAQVRDAFGWVRERVY